MCQLKGSNHELTLGFRIQAIPNMVHVPCIKVSRNTQARRRAPFMIKQVSISAILASQLISFCPAHAQSSAAPCSAFQKLPDGKWKAVRPINIQHDNATAVISPGTVIGPGTLVAGADLLVAKLLLG